MTKVSELVSQNVGSAITSYQTWGGILFNVKSYEAKGDGVTNDTTTIASAITAASVIGGIVFIPPGTFITDNQTIPANVTIWFANGAKFSVNSTKIVTINGIIEAGHYQIFTGSGTVVGTSKVDFVSPCWFGAKDDGTDISPALTKAIAFMPSVGGIIQFPIGGWWVLNNTVTVNKSSVTIKGQGKTGGTIINCPAMGADAFKVTGYGCIISDLRITGDANATGGYAIEVTGNDFIVSNVEIDSTPSGIYISGAAFTVDNVSISHMKPSTGYALIVNQSAGNETGFVNQLQLENTAGTQPTAGVLIEAGSAIQFVQCEFIHSGRGCWINPTVANVYSITFTDCYFDNCANQGLIITPNSMAVVKTRIVNCWFSSCLTGIEVQAGNAQGLTVIGCDIYQNTNNGVNIIASANIQYMNIEACNIAQNGGSGISIAAGVSNFMISNNIISPTAGYTANLYGVYINTGASDSYSVQGNIIKGNTSGQLVDGGTGTHKVVTNNITT